MTRFSLKRFWTKLSSFGFREGFRRTIYRKKKKSSIAPLANIDHFFLLNNQQASVEDEERKRLKASTYLFNASISEQQYPEALNHAGKYLRYAYIPAIEKAIGTVLVFHGHGGNAPPNPVSDFNILAPWDTFGYRRQGSWFWGEHGVNFVDQMITSLREIILADMPGLPWFTYGNSMGGFGALWHGIKYGCDGIYVSAPQVDLKKKIEDYLGKGSAYEYLQGDQTSEFPNLYEIAQTKSELPPLFLVQSQYDAVNAFGTHAYPLVNIYLDKKAWLGLRVYPGVGHKSHDGSFDEALIFFRLIVSKGMPKKAEFVK
jgi:hypothetical protein